MLIGLLLALIFGGGAESEFASSIPNLQKEIRRHVEDEIRKDTLLLLVKEYESTIKLYEKEKKKRFKQLNTVSTDRDLERKSRLNDRSTTRDEILEMYSLSNKLRYATARNFADLRQSVIENTSQQEWKAINKELKAFLKN